MHLSAVWGLIKIRIGLTADMLTTDKSTDEIFISVESSSDALVDDVLIVDSSSDDAWLDDKSTADTLPADKLIFDVLIADRSKDDVLNKSSDILRVGKSTKEAAADLTGDALTADLTGDALTPNNLEDWKKKLRKEIRLEKIIVCTSHATLGWY